MNTKSYVIIAFLIVVIISFSWIYFEYWKDEPIRLDPSEIIDYEGVDLSSIDDFRENSIKGPQYISLEDYTLEIVGMVENELSYSYDDVVLEHQLYEKVVTLHCVEGWDVTILWEGVLVEDLLEDARPSQHARVVIFYAYDGYSTSLPLDYIVENNVIMAHKMNDVILPPERGFPFQIVAENKYGYKWIKWITRIEVSDDLSYRGTWESRGFSNDADVP